MKTQREHMSVLKHELLQMIQKGAVQRVPITQKGHGWYSRYFLVPKADGGLRPILDLRRLNKLMRKDKFRMCTLAQVLLALSKGDWMVSLDLKDAYFHIPIHKAHRKYLRFTVAGEHYQFCVLPFGLTSAPRVFTKVLAVVTSLLRKEGIHVFPYLDDWLIKSSSEDRLRQHLSRVCALLFSLGFSLNLKKSQLVPSTRIRFIGAILDTALLRAFPPPERILSIQRMLQVLVVGSPVPAVCFQRMLGLMASCILLVPHARLRMRPLQWALASQWDQLTGNQHDKLTVTPHLARHLCWWGDVEMLQRGEPFRPPPPQITVVTDASLSGWGAHVLDLSTSALWSPGESSQHINLLELRAIRLALRSFLPSLQGRSVLVLTDNTTAMHYLNKRGGVRSFRLCKEALLLWEWAIHNNIHLQAAHLAGEENVQADTLSRLSSVSHEWSLHQEVLLSIFHAWGTPQVDLFATAENKKCLHFCARVYPLRGALGDAFTIPWYFKLVYAFPPLPLIGEVLARLKMYRCRMILIAPDWPRRVWYTDLLELSVATPFKLPLRADLLSQGGGQVLHPDPDSLKLHAWLLSG